MSRCDYDMGYAVGFVQFGNGFGETRERRDFDFGEHSGRSMFTCIRNTCGERLTRPRIDWEVSDRHLLADFCTQVPGPR